MFKAIKRMETSDKIILAMAIIHTLVWLIWAAV